MPPPGRNAPCLCGSGRKYKHCCGKQAPGSTAGAATWEADLVPIPISLGDDRDARPAALMIVRGDQVLQHDLLARPPAEPADIAALIGEAVRVTALRDGAPARVLVRHPVVATALRAALPDTDVAAGPLPGLDAAAGSLVSHMTGSSAPPPRGFSMPGTWRGWGLPAALIGEIFQAAARFHRARPWQFIGNEELMEFQAGAPRPWTLQVLGAAAEEFGLVLYEHRRDMERLLRARSPREGFGAIRGIMISLTLDRREDLPHAMRKEILAAGWEVAATDAYPVLLALNTPGGGLTERQGADLVAALTVVAKVAEGAREDASQGGRGPARPLGLTRALAEGAGAEPAAAVESGDSESLEADVGALLQRFEVWLDGSRLSERTRRRDLMNAELLLDFLSGTEGIPLRAMTEYDLRVFLHDWCIRKVRMPRADQRGVPVSLKRFFGFAAESLGVGFPWAAELLADRAEYEVRLASFPGGFFWDEAVQAWQAEVTYVLAALELIPDEHMAGGERWGDTMGLVELGLHRELRRRWLLWRDEVIESGIDEPAEVRKELLRRQRAWEKQPQAGQGGLAPVQAVLKERADPSRPLDGR